MPPVCRWQNEAQLAQHHTASEWQSWVEPRPSWGLYPAPWVLFWRKGRWQLVGNEKWPKVEDTVSNRGSSRRKTVSREGFTRSVWTERKV